MQRLLYIIGLAALGVGLYTFETPGLSAQQTAPPQERAAVVASAEPQSAVVRLAEASLAMRRVDGDPVMAAYPEPHPEKLFQKK